MCEVVNSSCTSEFTDEVSGGVVVGCILILQLSYMIMLGFNWIFLNMGNFFFKKELMTLEK